MHTEDQQLKCGGVYCICLANAVPLDFDIAKFSDLGLISLPSKLIFEDDRCQKVAGGWPINKPFLVLETNFWDNTEIFGISKRGVCRIISTDTTQSANLSIGYLIVDLINYEPKINGSMNNNLFRLWQHET